MTNSTEDLGEPLRVYEIEGLKGDAELERIVRRLQQAIYQA